MFFKEITPKICKKFIINTMSTFQKNNVKTEKKNF